MTGLGDRAAIRHDFGARIGVLLVRGMREASGSAHTA